MGNGDGEVYMDHTSDVDQIMEIVEQAFRLMNDGVYFETIQLD